MTLNHAKLSHSQNFLRDPGLVEKLVQKSSLTSDDVVLEIGPGKGIITGVLAKNSKRVLAVEADRGLYAELKEKFSSFSNVEIYYKNFLDFSLPEYEYKVFSNIPFNLTADIIAKLTSAFCPDISLEFYVAIPLEYGCFHYLLVLWLPLYHEYFEGDQN